MQIEIMAAGKGLRKKGAPLKNHYHSATTTALAVSILFVTISQFYLNISTDISGELQQQIGPNWSVDTQQNKDGPGQFGRVINISSTPSIGPSYIGQLNSTHVDYLVSFPWWDSRINKTNFRRGTKIWAHPTVRMVQDMIANTGPNDAFIDIGANVGFMTHYAVNSKRPVYAVEPISWNIAKLCEGARANINRGWVDASIVRENFHLFHAAAGPEFKSVVEITRPSDELGKFDAASLSRDAIAQKDVVTERIPMITVDLLIPNDVNVGAVKIDVQGHEYGVLLGMKKLLSRRVGYPKYVFYEDDVGMTKLAG